MAARTPTWTRCSSCGHTFHQEMFGQCPECGQWGTLEPYDATTAAGQRPGARTGAADVTVPPAVSLSDVASRPAPRITSGMSELDRVLGGGFVSGEVVLLSGSPGAGKALAGGTLIPLYDGRLVPLSHVGVGDVLCDMHDRPTTVKGVFNPHVASAYELELDGGAEYIHASEDHVCFLCTHSRSITMPFSARMVAFLFHHGCPCRVPTADGGCMSITAIRPIPVTPQDAYTCLSVDSPDKSFCCTLHRVATHNSTLSMTVANTLAHSTGTVLYVSGEESEEQIALRARRMKVDADRIKVVHETSIERIIGYVEQENPEFLIVDSLQTVASSSVSGAIGSVQQSREAAMALTDLAKRRSMMTILISQIVKSGDFSGPESIQHIVDATLMLGSDPNSPLKILRATKNRFGDTSDVGVFHHTDTGLEEVPDPSLILQQSVEEDGRRFSGTATTFMTEGVRHIPVEVQSLVTASPLNTPRRQFSGIDFSRAQIILAILDRFCRTKLVTKDVFINTVAGLSVKDPSADMAVAAAVLSSVNDIPFPSATMFVGEMSLTGQLRGTSMMDQKITETARLGFDRIVVPSLAKSLIHCRDHPPVAISFLPHISSLPTLLEYA